MTGVGDDGMIVGVRSNVGVARLVGDGNTGTDVSEGTADGDRSTTCGGLQAARMVNSKTTASQYVMMPIEKPLRCFIHQQYSTSESVRERKIAWE